MILHQINISFKNIVLIFKLKNMHEKSIQIFVSTLTDALYLIIYDIIIS